MKRLDVYAAYATVVIIFVVAIALNYIYFFPGADVIKDSTWQLVAPEPKYATGDVIKLQASFEKLQNAKALQSDRYIQCKNSRGVYDKYTASLVDAPASTKKGIYKDREIGILVPVVPKGSTCRVSISTAYKIRLIRNFTENKTSNEFRVE